MRVLTGDCAVPAAAAGVASVPGAAAAPPAAPSPGGTAAGPGVGAAAPESAAGAAAAPGATAAPAAGAAEEPQPPLEEEGRPWVSPLTDAQRAARIALRGVRHTINTFRDQRREALAAVRGRARNALFAV